MTAPPKNVPRCSAKGRAIAYPAQLDSLSSRGDCLYWPESVLVNRETVEGDISASDVTYSIPEPARVLSAFLSVSQECSGAGVRRAAKRRSESRTEACS